MAISPIELRRELHMNPELAFNEYTTQSILKRALEDLKLQPQVIAKTGLIVLVENDKSKPSILYRADMDALPIKEETNWDFSSQNQYMHACGHDVHMAVMYGVIKEVLEKNIKGNFVFVFQPAEETIGGAKHILDEMREKYKIKYATALHISDEYSLGEFATTFGTLFACAMEITAKFKGLSAHIAQKAKGVDALYNCVKFLNEFYEAHIDNDEIGKRVLVGFGKMFAGNVRNAVADYSEVQGSIRGEKLEIVFETFEKINKIARKYNGFLERGSLYPPVSNNSELVKLFESVVISNNYKFIDCGMKYTGEDFGFFSMKFPSLMFWAGVRTSDKMYGLHNPKFLPDDEVIPFLIEFMIKWLRTLSQGV